MTTDGTEDYFGVLGVSPDATDAEIKKAYHKLSLSLHPDKARDVEPAVAVARFQEMKLAYEVLMDPAARLAAAERQKVDRARKERRSAYEGKRKEMAEELERREEEDRAKRKKQGDAQRDMQRTLVKLREEGKRLREETERKRRQEQQGEGPAIRKSVTEQRQASDLTDLMKREQDRQQRQLRETEPELGPLDLTVTIKFPSLQYENLCQGDSELTGDADLDTRMARALQSRFGPLESLLFRAPKVRKSGQVASEATALATFKTLDGAFAAVRAGSQLRAGTSSGDAQCLQDVWIGWAAGVKKAKEHSHEDENTATRALQNAIVLGEPAKITWLRQRGLLPDMNEGREAHFSPDEKVGDDVGASREGQLERNKASEDDILGRMLASSTSKSAANSTEILNASTLPSLRSSRLSNPIDKDTERPPPSMHRSSAFANVAYESATLERMRDAERMRVEEAIRKADEEASH